MAISLRTSRECSEDMANLLSDRQRRIVGRVPLIEDRVRVVRTGLVPASSRPFGLRFAGSHSRSAQGTSSHSGSYQWWHAENRAGNRLCAARLQAPLAKG